MAENSDGGGGVGVAAPRVSCAAMLPVKGRATVTVAVPPEVVGAPGRPVKGDETPRALSRQFRQFVGCHRNTMSTS